MAGKPPLLAGQAAIGLGAGQGYALLYPSSNLVPASTELCPTELAIPVPIQRQSHCKISERHVYAYFAPVLIQVDKAVAGFVGPCCTGDQGQQNHGYHKATPLFHLPHDSTSG